MTTKRSNARRWLWPSLAILITGTVVYFFLIRKPGGGPEQVNCMVLSRNQIETYWMASIRNADTAKFNPTKGSAGLTVKSYLSQPDGASIPQTDVDLTAGANCAVTLPGSMQYNLNQVKLADLNLLDSAGALVEFDHLKLAPEDTVIGGNTYLYFNIYMVDRDGVEQFKIKSYPCPPHCPRPPNP